MQEANVCITCSCEISERDEVLPCRAPAFLEALPYIFFAAREGPDLVGSVGKLLTSSSLAVRERVVLSSRTMGSGLR